MSSLPNAFAISLAPVIVASLTLSGCVSHHSSDHTTKMRWSSGLESRSIEVRGSVEFTDDDRDVKYISPGGYVSIEDGSWLRPGRSYVVRSDWNGSLSRTYKVRGRNIPIDVEGEAWRAAAILNVIRETGADAPLRVDRLIAKGGPEAVLREVGEIHSDHWKRVYLQELVERGRLNSDQLRDVMRSARTIGSDGDKTELLMEVSTSYLESNVMDSWFSTLSGIGSDGDKRRGLEHIIRWDPSVETLALAAKAAGDIGSDGDKAKILSAIGKKGVTGAIRRTWFRAVQSIGSDGDKARVLSSMLAGSAEDPETLVELLRAVQTMGSDGDKARLLVEAARAQMAAESVQRAFFEAANSIGSDGDRKHVLESILREPGVAGSMVIYVSQSARKMGSDGDKASVLARIAELEMKDPETRTAFFTAVNSIGSDGERANVLGQVLKSPAVSSESAVAAIDSATKIGSDGERVSLLVTAAERHASNPVVRAHIEQTMRSLNSDGDYRRVSNALRR